jgi:hypothetical protein
LGIWGHTAFFFSSSVVEFYLHTSSVFSKRIDCIPLQISEAFCVIPSSLEFRSIYCGISLLPPPSALLSPQISRRLGSAWVSYFILQHECYLHTVTLEQSPGHLYCLPSVEHSSSVLWWLCLKVLVLNIFPLSRLFIMEGHFLSYLNLCG